MKNKPLEPTDFYIKDENEKSRRVWLAVRIGYKGQTYFTFDKQNFYSLFKDYPYKLTDEQIEIFKKGLPYWADFFKSRLEEKNSEDEQEGREALELLIKRNAHFDILDIDIIGENNFL